MISNLVLNFFFCWKIYQKTGSASLKEGVVIRYLLTEKCAFQPGKSLSKNSMTVENVQKEINFSRWKKLICMYIYIYILTAGKRMRLFHDSVVCTYQKRRRCTIEEKNTRLTTNPPRQLLHQHLATISATVSAEQAASAEQATTESAKLGVRNNPTEHQPTCRRCGGIRFCLYTYNFTRVQ